MANNPTAFNSIVSQIQNNQISTVSLSGSGITDADCVLLSNALKNSTSVTTLDLSINSIGAIGAGSLASVLQTNTKLQVLHLNSNAIGPDGANAFAETLRINRVLTLLDFGTNSIGVTGLIPLMQALPFNTALTELRLGTNSLGDSGASIVAQTLKDNANLQKLSLNSNSIGDAGASALLQALAHNYVLKVLNLSSNTYNNAIANQIGALIKRNSQCAGQILPILKCPLLSFNSLIVHKGERLILTSDHLQITNVGYLPLNGNFSVNNITHCEFLNTESESITKFSQIDINNGTISLQHDGSDIEPSFNVTASYNDLETWPIPAVVNFTVVPLITSTTPLMSTSTTSTSFTSSSSSSTMTTMPTTSTFATSTTTSRPFTTPSPRTQSITDSASFSPTSSLPFTSTSHPTTTAVAANSAAGRGTNLGAIIGGAAAGVAALGVGIFALHRYRRKRSAHIGVQPINTLAMVQNPVHTAAAGAAQRPPVQYDYVDAASLSRPPQARMWASELYTIDQPTRGRTSTQWDPTRYEVAQRAVPVVQYDTVDDDDV